MQEIVTIAPWHPWPLAVPVLLLAVGVALSMIGTRKRIKPLREGGYVVFLVAALAGAAMIWTLSGIWDTDQRQRALTGLGYESPTFGAGTSPVGDGADRTLPPIAFQAIRDGERVRGVLHHVGGDQWEVREVEDE